MNQIFKKLDKYFQHRWNFAVLDSGRGRWVVAPEVRNIPYLRAQNAQGRHIFMAPVPEIEPYYMLADDLSWTDIQCDHQVAGAFRAGRMVVETSPNNYQVWIRSDRAMGNVEKKYWLAKMGSDPGAAPRRRWGRACGFRNRKEKYRTVDGGYPLSRLVWVDWNSDAHIPEPAQTAQPAQIRVPESRQEAVCGSAISISRAAYDCGDESQTDFRYVLALMRRGVPMDEIHDRLISERANWTNHAGDCRRETYIARTIQSARQLLL